MVLAGPIFYSGDDGADVLRFYRDYMATAPDELAGLYALLTAPPAPFLPDHVHGTTVAAIVVCYAGDHEEGEKVLEPLRAAGRPLADLVGPMPYTVLQRTFDESQAPGRRNYWKSSYVNDLSDDVIDTVVAHGTSRSSPLTTVYFLRLEGAIRRVGEDDMAYSHRDARYDFNILSQWTDPEEDDRHIRWTREFWNAMQPFAARAVYVNNLGQEGSDRVREAYTAAKWQRLTALKTKYDPTNMFRLNQNITPTG